MKKAGKRGRVKRMERARTAGSVRRTPLEGERGQERKGSQEKGEVADLELPRSSGRLHPASSCARREKSARGARSTACAARTGVSRNPLNSYVTRARCVRRTPASIGGGACRLPAASPRNSRNQNSLSACYSHDLLRFSRKS